MAYLKTKSGQAQVENPSRKRLKMSAWCWMSLINWRDCYTIEREQGTSETRASLILIVARLFGSKLLALVLMPAARVKVNTVFLMRTPLPLLSQKEVGATIVTNDPNINPSDNIAILWL